MKKLKLMFLIGAGIALASCKDTSVEPEDLSGDWYSEEIYVNGKFVEEISTTTHLGLKENQTYYRNYVVGKWSFSSEKLYLSPNANIDTQPFTYEIESISDTSLTLKITLKEREYPWDFEDVEAEETITVIEKYRKH